MTVVLHMRWEKLAFLHWPVPVERVHERIPPELELDTFDGSAWLGVVPFEMCGVRFRGLPPIPGTRRFLELNLRTYVTHRGRPGVWFFSLDANSRLSVRGARKTFALPYFDASMSMVIGAGDEVEYSSERTHAGAPPASFRGRYRPLGGAPRIGAPGSLEHFLTERYSLFAQRGWGVQRSLRGGLVRGDIEHEPWRLRPAEIELERCGMFALGGAEPETPLGPAVAHLAEPLDVRAHAPVRV